MPQWLIANHENRLPVFKWGAAIPREGKVATRIVWWEVLLIGVVVLLVGVYVTVASQNEISYLKTCEKPIACGGPGQENLTSHLFLTSSQTASMQLAQLGSVLGIAAIAFGLVGVAYGVYIHPSVRPQPPSQPKPGKATGA